MPSTVSEPVGIAKGPESLKKEKSSQKAGDIAYDRRHPLYLGDWERTIAWKDTEFAKEELDDPHMKRKLAILAKHPQIPWLYQWDRRSAPIGFMAVAVQLVLAFGFGRVWTGASWALFLAAAFVIGGSMTHIIGVLMHEACHCMMARTPLQNKLWGLFINIPVPVPISLSFRRYHFEHHTFQGVVGRDPDLPMDWERTLIRGTTWKKVLWMAIYPALYAVRGAAFGNTPSNWEIINWISQLTVDALIYRVCGWKGLLYCFMSLWLGYSFHPGAAHFIQEHYTYLDGQETYSYYGALGNLLFLNIGFHNEHHDFPKVPWSLLPLLKASAPEFYDPLAFHASWRLVLWSFLTDRELGPPSRVIRSLEDYRRARKELGQARNPRPQTVSA